MGRGTVTRSAYVAASAAHAPSKGPVTNKAVEQLHETGKLDPLVDPKEFGVIRQSRPRFEQQKNGLWLMTVGTPVHIETRLDTTASMGDNVDIAFAALPNMYEFCAEFLKGCDLQIATGVFNDYTDLIVLCRPQFEMEADKIVKQLTLMTPLRGGGGNGGEDPHYGLFGATYLTSTYLNKIGLKGYDFTITDEPARYKLDNRQLRRVFGDDVFAITRENGYEINERELPSTQEVIQELLKRAHAFVLCVERGDSGTLPFWKDVMGTERVIALPNALLVPQVQAVIIGLTEGTLSMRDVETYLKSKEVNARDAAMIARSVAGIPIGAQAMLPNFKKRPKEGDLFLEKTSLWPMTKREIADYLKTKGPEVESSDTSADANGPVWL